MGYNNHKVCQSNSLRESCFSDTDCGRPGECCRGNKCTKTGCDECQKNSDCSGLFSKYCCKKRYVNEQNTCSITCFGESCQRDSDCGPRDECCGTNNKCTKTGCDECQRNSDCSGFGFFSKYCCKKRYVNEQNTCSITCFGESCQRDSDCGPRDECCGIYNHCVKTVHVATHSGKLTYP